MPTILLADDSITIQKIVNLTFSGEGIDVITVGNGEAAVKKIHEQRPALVLADIFMPGKNGYEVCDYIKNEPSLSAIPVILLVGAFEPFDSNEAARVKADGHLTKPFEIKVLISAVNSLITATAAQKDDAEPIEELAVSEVAEPIVSEVAEPFVSEIAESAYEEPSVPTFAPLPEMPITSQSVEIELSEELASLEPPPVEEPTSVALGVDVQDLAGPPLPVAPDPVAETSSIVDEVEDLMPADFAAPTLHEPQTSAPALMIEESDPLGLLSGEGVDTGGEIALDARSMVVDIWEPRTATETAAPPVPAEPATVLVEEKVAAVSTADLPAEDVPVVDTNILESTIEVAPVESPDSQQISPELEPAAQFSAETLSASAAVSDELIERIANRVVEKLSRDVIERIAWEVVPDLAELMIREHVESQLKESQSR